MIIGGGIYAYNVYSKVSKTLEEVHKPLKRDEGNKQEEKLINLNQYLSY